MLARLLASTMFVGSSCLGPRARCCATSPLALAAREEDPEGAELAGGLQCALKMIWSRACMWSFQAGIVMPLSQEWREWLPTAFSQDLVAALVLLLSVVLLRLGLGRLIRRTRWANEELKLKWRAQVRMLIFVVLCFGVLLIWGSELRTLALSLVAVAVALVIATKEWISCVMGSLFRFSSKSFSVGDRVEIGGIRGDVIDTGLVATKLLETGPAHDRTGRMVVVPNSLLLMSRVINETFTDDYVLHVFPIPLGEVADWQRAEQALLEAARSVTEPYLATTRTSLAKVDKQHRLERPAHPLRGEPVVLLRVAEKGMVELIARVPTLARDKGNVEQEIVRRYLLQMAQETPTARDCPEAVGES
jgi:small-conductance mechanosensitive channel